MRTAPQGTTCPFSAQNQSLNVETTPPLHWLLQVGPAMFYGHAGCTRLVTTNGTLLLGTGCCWSTCRCRKSSARENGHPSARRKLPRGPLLSAVFNEGGAHAPQGARAAQIPTATISAHGPSNPSPHDEAKALHSNLMYWWTQYKDIPASSHPHSYFEKSTTSRG